MVLKTIGSNYQNLRGEKMNTTHEEEDKCEKCDNSMSEHEINDPDGERYNQDFNNNTGDSNDRQEEINKQKRVHVCPDQVEQVSHILNKDDKARERDS